MTIVNPYANVYSDTTDIEQYYFAGALLNVGEEMRQNPKVQAARLAGAEVLQYFDVVECRNKFVGPLDAALHAGVQPWPVARSNYPGTFLTDMRIGSSWFASALNTIRNLMLGNEVDGVYLDVHGARLWNNILNQWDTWTPFEKDAFALGCAAFVKQLDQMRRTLNPRFIIVTNGLWQRDDGTFMTDAEQAIDGVCIEHHSPIGGNGQIGTFNTIYAGRQFANLGHRRVLIIANSFAEALQWMTVGGVTHISFQLTENSGYAKVGKPVCSFTRINYYM